jgi:hypothetical protein
MAASTRTFRGPLGITCAALTLGTGLLVAAPQTALAARADGYVRLAHLSPDTPAVDVYLYSGSTKTPKLVLRHVPYGALSPYQKLPTGSYTVAMRPADAPAASKPVLSTKVTVDRGQAYTVAGMGPYKGIRLQVLDDSTTPSSGKAALRVIEASIKVPTIKVTCAGKTWPDSVKFGDATDYHAITAKSTSVKVAGDSGGSASVKVPLSTGSVHTVVVLDGGSGLKLLDLRDTTSGAVTPRGGVDTGLGGLAPKRTGLDWRPAAALALLAALTGIGIARRRATR